MATLRRIELRSTERQSVIISHYTIGPYLNNEGWSLLLLLCCPSATTISYLEAITYSRNTFSLVSDDCFHSRELPFIYRSAQSSFWTRFPISVLLPPKPRHHAFLLRIVLPSHCKGWRPRKDSNLRWHRLTVYRSNQLDYWAVYKTANSF